MNKFNIFNSFSHSSAHSSSNTSTCKAGMSYFDFIAVDNDLGHTGTVGKGFYQFAVKIVYLAIIV